MYVCMFVFCFALLYRLYYLHWLGTSWLTVPGAGAVLFLKGRSRSRNRAAPQLCNIIEVCGQGSKPLHLRTCRKKYAFLIFAFRYEGHIFKEVNEDLLLTSINLSGDTALQTTGGLQSAVSKLESADLTLKSADSTPRSADSTLESADEMFEADKPAPPQPKNVFISGFR